MSASSFADGQSAVTWQTQCIFLLSQYSIINIFCPLLDTLSNASNSDDFCVKLSTYLHWWSVVSYAENSLHRIFIHFLSQSIFSIQYFSLKYIESLSCLRELMSKLMVANAQWAVNSIYEKSQYFFSWSIILCLCLPFLSTASDSDHSDVNLHISTHTHTHTHPHPHPHTHTHTHWLLWNELPN